MISPDPENKPKVTLEQLLKLKRLEQPTPAFWDNFNREIKTKKLQLLLDKSRPTPWNIVLKPLFVSGPALAALLMIGVFLTTGPQNFFANYGTKLATGPITVAQRPRYQEMDTCWAHTQLQSSQYVWDTMSERSDLLSADTLSFTPQDDYTMHVLEFPLVAQYQQAYGAI